MGENDIVLKRYLSNNRRFADLINGCLFGGERVVNGEELEEESENLNRVKKGQSGKMLADHRQRDVVKKLGNGTRYLILAEENQSFIDYRMPVRVMEYESMEYRNQLVAIEQDYSDAQEQKLMTRHEYLSHMKREDSLAPVVTLVVYFGQEPWDAKTELHEMLNLPKDSKFWKYMNNVKLNLFDFHNVDNYDQFETDLRELFLFLRNSNDKDSLLKVVNENRERFDKLSVETVGVIETCTKTNLLSKSLERQKNEEAISMCKALEDLVRDSRDEGKLEGKLEGKIEGKLEGKIEGKMEGKIEGKLEGKLLGKMEALLDVLSEYGTVRTATKNRILAQTDINILNVWLKHAIRSSSLGEFYEKIGE